MSLARACVVIVAALSANPALAGITVNSGTVNVSSIGSAGRLGSTTGIISDDPDEISGTSDVLSLPSTASGGPVGPGDLPTLPGTTTQFDVFCNAFERWVGDVDGLIITQGLAADIDIINMDGAVVSTSATGYTRTSISVDIATPYTLTGYANFDDQDTAGSMTFNGHFINRSSNGEFSFSGTLQPNINYSLNSSASISESFSSGSGNFAESASYYVVLVVGSANGSCDSIDFNNDGIYPDNQDVVDFISVFGSGPCSTNICNDLDFNNDGVFPDFDDFVTFLRVYGAGTCAAP